MTDDGLDSVVPSVPAHGLKPGDWAAVDEALGRFTAESVTPLLGAVIDAPWSRPWQRPLTVLWLRSIWVPPSGVRPASSADLGELVNTAVGVLGVPVLPSAVSNDPRHLVGFSIAGRRWRLHPGDYLYPLMLLRRLATMAVVVDDALLHAVGFTFTDVIEVALSHCDDMMTRLAKAWSSSYGTSGTDEPDSTPVVSSAEIMAVVASMAAHREVGHLADQCREPDRAAQALAWLTSDVEEVVLADTPGIPMLGPVLRLRSAGMVFPVLASLTLDALNAAADALLRKCDIGDSEAARLAALTYGHAFAVFRKKVYDRSAPIELELSEGPIIVGSRTVATVVSAMSADSFGSAIRRANLTLDHRRRQPEGHASDDGLAGADLAVARLDDLVKVVVYGGPLVINFHQVRDAITLHIEELVEIVDAAGGDWTTVECFLQDLGEHTGHELVIFQDILDVWAAWRDWGRIGPPIDQGDDGNVEGEDTKEDPVLHVVAAEYDSTWVHAAEWEAIDTVLAAAGIPEHRDWPLATMSPGGSADLFTTPNGTMALVNADPAMIIFLDGADAAMLNLDVDTYFGLADGIRYCVTRHADVSAHFRLSDTPITIALHLTEERAPNPDHVYGVQVACAPDRALLDIVLGPDVLELFASDPMSGHGVVGMALHELVRRVRAGRAADLGTPEATFREAWQQVGPLMTLHIAPDDRPQASPVDTLPRTPAVRVRALRAVAERLRVAPGTYSDASAHAICRDKILPTIEGVLRDRIASCDPSLVRHVAARLNAAFATHLRRGRQIAHALAGPWARNWHDAARDDERHVNVNALQVLFEAILAEPPAGTRQVDALQLAELAALTELLVLVSAAADGFARDVHGLQVEVGGDGLYVVQRSPMAADEQADDDESRLDIDLDAYRRTEHDEVITLATQDPWTIDDLSEYASREHARLPLAAGPRYAVPFQPLANSAQPSLLTADALLMSGWATGLDGLAAVLGTAGDWPTDDDGITTVDPGVLARAAAEWSGLPNAQTHAATQLLQIGADELRSQGDGRFLNVERRSHRLLTRPLAVVDGRVLVMPWLIYASRQIHNRYIEAARLAYPASALPPGVIDAMTRHRQGRNNELATTVRDVVAGLGLPFLFQFSQTAQADAGIRHPIGEIDLLIADPANARLWVCEVKDLNRPYSIAAIRDHVRRFTHGRKAFTPKLLKKAEQIQRHAQAVARACGVMDESPWRAKPLIVTRHVEPAAYAKNPMVAFTTPNLLREVLQDPVDPREGPAPRRSTSGR